MIVDNKTTTAATTPEATPTGVSQRRRTTRVATALLVAAVLASLTGAAWTLRDVRHERDDQERDRSVLAAGREAAVAFTSYDYRHIGDDLDRVATRSTGEFREQFTKALGALTAAIKKAHGVSEGQVLQAGILRSSNESAVVIAAVDAEITNRETKGPSVRRYRLQITLNLVDEDWLIADIKPVA
jgi:Mce-associated membrane protein